MISHQLHLELLDQPRKNRDGANYSNTVEIYDLVGKYIYEKKKKFFSNADASDMDFTRAVDYRPPGENVSIPVHVTVTAGKINREKDGVSVFAFPGPREECVEDVIRMLASNGDPAITYHAETGYQLISISFSLYQVFTELKALGKCYSYAEIREALNILNAASLEISSDYPDKVPPLRAAFFPVKNFVKNAQGNDRCQITFHPAVSSALFRHEIRQFDYQTALMKLDRHYTRLLYKRLSHRFIQAGIGTYNIKLSTLIASWKTPAANFWKDATLVKMVLDDLVENRVIESGYTIEPIKDGKKTIDQKITVVAHDNFISQQASAGADKKSKLAALPFRPSLSVVPNNQSNQQEPYQNELMAPEYAQS